MKTSTQTTQTRRSAKAVILTPTEWLNYPPRRLPDSWYQAAGLLKSKKKSLERHLKTIRKEWDEWHKDNERTWKKYLKNKK